MTNFTQIIDTFVETRDTHMSEQSSSLPNALIIGVQKSATSWLAARLRQHPDIFVVPGEVHFFDNEQNFSKGRAWYEKHFRGAEMAAIRCEKTGAYSWTECDGVPGEPQDKPERIKAMLPDVRMIMVLRDPVARAISAWNHLVRSARLPAKPDVNMLFEPANESFVRRHGVLTRGFYARQLARFYACFPPEKLLVLIQERDVIEAPENGLRKACSFLGVSPDFAFQSTDRPENRFETTWLGNRIAASTPESLRGLSLRADRHLLTKLPLERLPYPQASAFLKEKLAAYYEEECRDLQGMIGELPSAWLDGRLFDRG